MCGIWPLNPNIFSDDDFLPSTVTDQTVSEDPPNDQPLDIINMPIEFVNNEVPLNQTVEEQSTSSLIVISSNISTEPLKNNVLQASTSKITKSPVSPADIIPLPKITLKRKRRTKGKKSEILSSTPYKNQIETLEKDKENAKLISEKNKADKKARRNLFETKSKPNKKKVVKKADTSEQVSTTVNAESATTVTYKENCPACNEKYEDPPTEDWIMCCKCKIWWHEACSYYEDPHKDFVCDLCS